MKFRNVTTEVEEKYEVKDDLVDKVVKQYNEIINEASSLGESFGKRLYTLRSGLYNTKAYHSEVLTPNQINLTLIEIIKTGVNSTLRKFGAGYFTTKLIQRSYNEGYNDFKLFTNNTAVISLNQTLRGKKENPIKIIIDGNADIDFCETTKYVDCEVKGDIIKNSTFSFYSQQILNQHKKIKNASKGREKKWWNKFNSRRISEHSTFTFSGKWDGKYYESPDIINCTFKIKNKEAYNWIKRNSFPRMTLKNLYQLIDKEGNVIEEMKSSNMKIK